jgi:hypothetical protein
VLPLFLPGNLGILISAPDAIFNWLQCERILFQCSERLGRRFEYYTVVACLAPVVLLLQLYFFSQKAGTTSSLTSYNTQIVLSIYVSVIWLVLVLLQLLIGIIHKNHAERFNFDM